MVLFSSVVRGVMLYGAENGLGEADVGRINIVKIHKMNIGIRHKYDHIYSSGGDKKGRNMVRGR